MVCAWGELLCLRLVLGSLGKGVYTISWRQRVLLRSLVLVNLMLLIYYWSKYRNALYSGCINGNQQMKNKLPETKRLKNLKTYAILRYAKELMPRTGRHRFTGIPGTPRPFHSGILCRVVLQAEIRRPADPYG